MRLANNESEVSSLGTITKDLTCFSL